MPKQGLSTAPSPRALIGTLTAPFIVMSVLMMTGCATPIQPLPDKLPLPANLTSHCPNLEPLSDGTGASVLRKLIEVSELYYECQRKHKALVEAVE